jgi:hypothetical protein
VALSNCLPRQIASASRKSRLGYFFDVPEGLYLASMFLFRFMHPPLLIPWSEIKVRRQKGWVFEYVIFTLGHERAIPLRIRAKSAQLWHLPL